MQRVLKQAAWVFGLWTLVALSTGVAHYVLDWAVGRDPDWLQVMRRPLTEQWIWAAFTPIVFALTRRVPLARTGLGRALAVHTAAFALLSVAHCLIAEAVGGPLAWLPDGVRLPSVVLRFLEEFYSDLWMYWPLVGIQSLLDAQARERAREREAHRLEALVARTRLDMLRAQIQPHFLFNTLHAISALLRVDPRAAEDMIADLADLLRSAFADRPTQETRLRDELALVDVYLRIQQRRYGERLQVRRDIDAGLLDAAVPALLLQPLVENAVVHGLAPLSRTGTLRLVVAEAAGRLSLQVIDDGTGLAAPTGGGLGLANTRERLQRLYGDAQSFELTSMPGRGTAIHILLPLHHLPAAADTDAEHVDARPVADVTAAAA